MHFINELFSSSTKHIFHKSARTAIATHFDQEHFQQVPSSPCVDALSVNTRQVLTDADKEETFSYLVLGIKSPQILRQTQMNIQTNEGCLGVPIPWGHLSCTGSHITRICCIYVTHRTHHMHLLYLCLYWKWGCLRVYSKWQSFILFPFKFHDSWCFVFTLLWKQITRNTLL